MLFYGIMITYGVVKIFIIKLSLFKKLNYKH